MGCCGSKAEDSGARAENATYWPAEPYPIAAQLDADADEREPAKSGNSQPGLVGNFHPTEPVFSKPDETVHELASSSANRDISELENSGNEFQVVTEVSPIPRKSHSSSKHPRSSPAAKRTSPKRTKTHKKRKKKKKGRPSIKKFLSTYQGNKKKRDPFYEIF